MDLSFDVSEHQSADGDGRELTLPLLTSQPWPGQQPCEKKVRLLNTSCPPNEVKDAFGHYVGHGIRSIARESCERG